MSKEKLETGTHTADHSPRYTTERDRCGSWLWIFRDNRPFIKFMKGTEGEARKVADFLNGGGIEWRPKVQDVTVSPTTASGKSEARVRATADKSVEYSRPDSIGEADHSRRAEMPRCGEFVCHLIAGASWCNCVLPKGHDGEHRAGGNCFKHGKYVGEPHSFPQCPQWPDCIVGNQGAPYNVTIAASPEPRPAPPPLEANKQAELLVELIDRITPDNLHGGNMEKRFEDMTSDELREYARQMDERAEQEGREK